MKQWQKYKNDQVIRQKLQLREWVMDGIRIFFKKQGFAEVETPLFVASPDPEPTIELFETFHKANNYSVKGYLNGSPEFMMKKLLAADSGNIFQICKSFRNGEPVSSRHNPEFTILEWYRVEADYQDIMTDCEQLFIFLHQYVSALKNKKLAHAYDLDKVSETDLQLHFSGRKYDLSPGWQRLGVSQAFEKYASISPDELLDERSLLSQAKAKGYQVNESTTYDDAFYQIMLNEIEPFLGETKPTFLYDYPTSQAALSKKKVTDPRLAERFELYLGGLELGNAFSELADWQEQKARFENQLSTREKNGQSHWKVDADFISALQEGFPRCGGIAVGVDRLIMLFADAAEIKEVLFFPADEVFDLED